MELPVRAAVSRLAGALLCAASLVPTAATAQTISGKVTAGNNGAPLAGVGIKVEIRTLADAATTDGEGRFAIDLASLFSAAEIRDADGEFMLKFAKANFEPMNRLVRVAPGASAASVAVRLDAKRGSTHLDAKERQALDPYAAAPGSTPLFLLPYSLSGVPPDKLTHLNERLRWNLERLIVSHVQAAVSGEAGAVSLTLLPALRVNDTNHVRAYGSYLRALGVITGQGAVESQSGGGPALEVSSAFLVIPRSPAISVPALYVDDSVPADRVDSPRLYRHLSELWGRSAVLALGVKELSAALQDRDPASRRESLKRIRGYLQAERSNAGPGNDALVSQLQSVIAVIDGELRR